MNNYSQPLLNEIKKLMEEGILNQFRNAIGRLKENSFEQRRLFEEGMHEQQKSFEQRIQEIKTIITDTLSPPNTNNKILDMLTDFNQNILNNQNSLTTANNSINKVYKKFNSIDNVLMNTNNSLNQLHRKITSFENELANIKNSINQISQKYNVINNVPTIPKDSTETVDKKFNSFEQILTNINNTMNQIHQKFNSIENKSPDTKAPMEPINKKFNSFEQILTNINNTMNQIHQKFNSFDNTFADQNGSIELINQKFDSFEQKLTNANNSINQVHQKVNFINTIVANTKDSIEPINQKFNSFEQEFMNTNNSINQVNQKFTSFNNAIINANNSINQIHQKFNSFENIITNPKDSIECIHQKFNYFEQILLNTSNSINQVNKQIESIDTILTNTSNTNDSINQVNKQIESIDTILTNTSNTNNLINQVNKQLISIDSILTNPTNSIERINQKINSFEEILTNATNSVEQVSNNLNSLSSTVEDVFTQNNTQLFQQFKLLLDKFEKKFNGIPGSISEILDPNLTRINTSISKVVENTTEIYNNSLSIKNLNLGMRLKDSNNKDIHSILELPNERIAAGSNEDICIWKIDLVNKTSELKKTKKKAHSKIISSLCNLSESRIASSSEDALIKIWKLKEKDEDGKISLKLIGTIEGNFSWVTIIIPIIYDKENFIVSCIPEKSWIKIWKCELAENVEFKSEDIQTLSKGNRKPRSILEIKSKNILVSSWETFSESEQSCLIFYEFHKTSYSEKNKLEYVYSQNKGIVQVNDNYIAVLNEYSKNQPEICLIDLTDFTLQKRINNLDIKTYGSLTRINDSSFIYSNVGVVCQILRGINNRDFKIVSLMKNCNSLDGRKGIIVSKGGKYIYGVDMTYGIFLINAYY